MLKYVEYVFLSAPQDKRVLLIMAHAGLGRKVEGKCIIYHMLPEVALEAVSLLGIMMAPWDPPGTMGKNDKINVW